MVGLHSYLLWSNQTTIEMYYNRSQARAAQRRGQVASKNFRLCN